MGVCSHVHRDLRPVIRDQEIRVDRRPVIPRVIRANPRPVIRRGIREDLRPVI